jgi:hypothetical protein
MKTPREILLKRHEPANEKLDAIREQILVAECGRKTRNPKLETRNLGTLPLLVGLKLWRELIWPARRIWAGFAAVWLLLVAVNLADADHSATDQAGLKPLPAGSLATWEQQQQILAELIGQTEPHETDQPKPILPQPRSERRQSWLMA